MVISWPDFEVMRPKAQVVGKVRVTNSNRSPAENAAAPSSVALLVAAVKFATTVGMICSDTVEKKVVMVCGSVPLVVITTGASVITGSVEEALMLVE